MNLLSLRLRHRIVKSRIKSIQRDTVAINGAATSATKTIVAADPTNSLLYYLGHSSTGSDSSGDPFRSNWARLEFTNATTITAIRNAGAPLGPGNVTVSFAVVEYYPGVIRSIQRDTVVTTKTVAAVNLARAELIGLGLENTGADSALAIFQQLSRMILTNATTVTGTGGGTQGFQLVEWV